MLRCHQKESCKALALCSMLRKLPADDENASGVLVQLITKNGGTLVTTSLGKL